MSKGRPYSESIQEKLRLHVKRENREAVKLTRDEMRDLGHLSTADKQRSVYASVRMMCVDCMGGAGPQDSKGDIRRCTSVGCPLWPFRFGKRLETVASRLLEGG
jgi:hypothetical protein